MHDGIEFYILNTIFWYKMRVYSLVKRLYSVPSESQKVLWRIKALEDQQIELTKKIDILCNRSFVKSTRDRIIDSIGNGLLITAGMFGFSYMYHQWSDNSK
jgi:uncharacterized membrane protein